MTLPSGAPRRLLAIGDIHGCHRQLRGLLDRLRPIDSDQLVFLGDYIDRGPDSAGVIEVLLALRARFPRSVFLRGNHDQMLLDVLAGEDPTLFLCNGGGKTIASYQARGGWPPPGEHRQFLEALPVIYQTEQFIFVHAGLRPGIPLTGQKPEDLLWIRQGFLDSRDDWGKIVVFGHTPREEPLLEERRIGLDTGCVYGGHLTGCDLLTRRCWQVLG
jgi:serine/threonine protein phosphatase 1